MGTSSSNLSSTSEIFENIEFIGSVDNKSYIVVQGLGFIYTLVCVCWLVYIIYKLIALIRNRKSLINLSYLEHDYIPNMIIKFVSSCTERISYAILYFLFSSVLRFYFLTINLFGIPIIFINYQDILIPIAPNCT